MLNTFIKSKGLMKTITHNNNETNSNEINMDADYDGNVANIKLQTNNNGENKDYNIKLTNDDLENILNVPSINKPLNLRLENDFKNKSHHRRKPLVIEFENPSFLDSDYNFTDNSSSSNDLFDLISSTSSNDLFDFKQHLSSPNSQEELIIPLTLDNNSKLNLIKKHKKSKKRKDKTHKIYKIKKRSHPNNSSSSSSKYHYSPRRRIYSRK